MTEVKQQDHIAMLHNVRLAFAQLWTAKQVNNDGKAAFSAAFLMTPDHPDIAALRAIISQVAAAKWGVDGAETLKILIAGDRICLRNGDAKANYDGFAGNMYVSSRSPSRPLVIAQDRSALAESDGKPYSGCFVNAQIAVWAQQNTHGKRINAQLRGVQFLRDGDAFGGGGVAQPDEFDVVEGAGADAEAPVVGDEWGLT